MTCDFERSEAAAKIMTLMIVLISDETWHEQVTTESQSNGLRKAMISYMINSSIIPKLSYILSFLRDKSDFDHFTVNSLSLLTEFMDVLHSNRDQLLSGPGEDNFLHPLILAGLKKTDLVGILSLMEEALMRSGPVQKKGLESPRPGKDFTKIASQGLDLLNNIAKLDLEGLQALLSAGELGVQLAHLLVNTVISTTSVYWRKEQEVEYTPALMAQLLLLVTHFALRNRGNQDQLRGDSAPVLLHLARLPFHFFLHTIFKDQLFPALIAACYDNEANITFISQDLSVGWLVTYLEQLRDDKLRDDEREKEKEKDKDKPAKEKEKEKDKGKDKKDRSPESLQRILALLPLADFDVMITYFRERIPPPALIKKGDKDDRERQTRQPQPVPEDAQSESPPPDSELVEEEPQVPLPFEDPLPPAQQEQKQHK